MPSRARSPRAPAFIDKLVSFAREALLQPPFVPKPVNFVREATGMGARVAAARTKTRTGPEGPARM